MKNRLALLACVIFALTACHRESELEKLVRHANQQCPITITDGMRLDSVCVDKPHSADSGTTRLTYHVTLFGIYEEAWMKDVVEANLAGLDERQVSALLSQGLADDPKFERILHRNDCSLALVLQYADGLTLKAFDIDIDNAVNTDCESATMDIIRRDVQNSNAACPMQIADGIVMQSVAFDEGETVIVYLFRIGDETLTPENVDRTMLEGLQASLAADLENNPSMRIYRDNGITIRYRFENSTGEYLYGFDF